MHILSKATSKLLKVIKMDANKDWSDHLKMGDI